MCSASRSTTVRDFAPLRGLRPPSVATSLPPLNPSLARHRFPWPGVRPRRRRHSDSVGRRPNLGRERRPRIRHPIGTPDPIRGAVVCAAWSTANTQAIAPPWDSKHLQRGESVRFVAEGGAILKGPSFLRTAPHASHDSGPTPSRPVLPNLSGGPPRLTFGTALPNTASPVLNPPLARLNRVPAWWSVTACSSGATGSLPARALAASALADKPPVAPNPTTKR